MTSTEKFCLKWNDFRENIAAAYKNIRGNEDFSDVTLVCEDDQQVEAHRVILSASSPFFMKVLKKSKHPHPMIYMRGLTIKDMLAIVDFIYYGEAKVFQEDLDEFLSLAEELQLKGLTGSSTEESSPQSVVEENKSSLQQISPMPQNITPKSQKMPPRQKLHGKIPYSMGQKEEVLDSSFENHGTVAIPDINTPKITLGNIDELDGQINTMIQKLHASNEWSCTVCGKASKVSSNIRNHIESNHIEGMEHPCHQCGKVSRSKQALVMHIHLHHKQKVTI